MGFVKSRRPAGVIDGDIHDQTALPGMHGVDELDELFQGRGRGIEFGQSGVDLGEAERRIGAAEAPHPPVGRRRGMDGQQLHVPAAQLCDDEIELSDEIPEGAGLRDHRVTVRVHPLNPCGHVRVDPGADGFVGAELADKRVIDDISAAAVRGLYVEGRVGPFGPDGVGFTFRQKIGLGLEMPDLGQGNHGFKTVRRDFPHRDIVPVPAERRHVIQHFPDDFPPGYAGPADVGAEPRAAAPTLGGGEHDGGRIPAKSYGP